MEEFRDLVLKTSRKSPLYRWMRENFAEIEKILSEAGRPNWTAISKWLGEKGLVDATGKTPTSERARQTWFDVRGDLGKTAAKRTRKRPLATEDGTVTLVREPIAKPEPDPASTQDPSDVDARLAKAADAMGFPWDPKPKPKKRTE
jgi:hypothetical protein